MEFKTLNEVNDGESARAQQHHQKIMYVVHVMKALRMLGIGGKGVMVEDSLTSTGIRTGPDPILSRPNDKEKMVVWPCKETILHWVSHRICHLRGHLTGFRIGFTLSLVLFGD